VYAVQKFLDESWNVPLGNYSAGTWYHVTVSADLSAKLFDVFINGVVRVALADPRH
jgi:hypothetical protein